MLTGLQWLALEVKYLDPAVEFYRSHLDLEARERTENEARLAVGPTDLVLRSPSGVPRGGLHTHYAMSVPSGAYDDWWDRLSASFDLHEERFGSVRSLYFYDTEGNCVELMGSDDGDDETVTGLVEVVLEVESLDRAEAFYRALGMEVVDRGGGRKRTRLSAGPFDFELWEPHLGLADARGGVHVDLGLTADVERAVAAIEDEALSVEWFEDGGARVRDPDGHYLTFREG
ncbi:VOC family protein [Salinirubellus sp. GCM10025818]|uniref:VOC family protein n=1 Tax=Salinirubellus TaxID=2162630 RepID=UPI0030D4DADE